MKTLLVIGHLLPFFEKLSLSAVMVMLRSNKISRHHSSHILVAHHGHSQACLVLAPVKVADHGHTAACLMVAPVKAATSARQRVLSSNLLSTPYGPDRHLLTLNIVFNNDFRIIRLSNYPGRSTLASKALSSAHLIGLLSHQPEPLTATWVGQSDSAGN